MHGSLIDQLFGKFGGIGRLGVDCECGEGGGTTREGEEREGDCVIGVRGRLGVEMEKGEPEPFPPPTDLVNRVWPLLLMLWLLRVAATPVLVVLLLLLLLLLLVLALWLLSA